MANEKDLDGDVKLEIASGEVSASQDSHEKAIGRAKAATAKEHRMGLMEGVRTYPKAIGWSMLISLCIAMEAFDLCLLNTFYGLPQFQQHFGQLQSDGTYQISAPWQAGLNNGRQAAEFIGLIINGWVSERFGYRWTVIVCLTLIAAWTTIYFTANTLVELLVAGILCGIPWGIFQTLAITYASECCPVALRGYLTTWVNFCWGLGQVIGVGSIVGCQHIEGPKAFRIPYALQWMWPLPLAIGIWLAPESPWWLVRKGRLEDAKKALLRLTSVQREADFDADETIAMIAHTAALEQQITSGASYFDCFKGVDLRRTEIVCMVWAIQNLSGNSFAGYSTYFLEQAGLSSSYALDFTLGKQGINMVGVFGAWLLMTIGIGRRSLYLYGLCGLFVILLVLGFLGLPADRNAASLATGSMMLIWAAVYQCTVGTVCYSLVAELSTRRLQIKTVAMGRAAYNIVAILCNILSPYMLNPTAWNWGNYAGFFWAGAAALSIVYTYFRIPEPSGRTFAELDMLFERGICARKFATAHVDAFAETVQGGVMQEYEEKMKQHV